MQSFFLIEQIEGHDIVEKENKVSTGKGANLPSKTVESELPHSHGKQVDKLLPGYGVENLGEENKDRVR